MFLVDKVAKDQWLIANNAKPGVVLFAYFTLIGKYYTLYVSQVDTTHYNENHMSFIKEIYTTEFWALDPTKTTEEILNNFVGCKDMLNPIEMVYHYGGQVLGSPVRIPTKEGLH